MKLRKIGLMGIVFIITIYLALSCSYSVFAAGWKIEALQKEIDARGYKWKAGKTSLSGLSPEEFKSMLGAKLPENIQMMPAEMRFALPYGQPTSLDWRNYNGGNWITSVKNQQQCGSCYSFGTLGTMETLIKFSQSDPSYTIDLSEQYIVSCGPDGTDEYGHYGGCDGNYTDYICDYLVSTGAPDELCFSYDSAQQAGTEPPCSNACADVASRVYKVSTYSFIAGGGVGYVPNPEDIKAVVVNKPVPCAFLVYEDLLYYTGGIYKPVPEPDEEGGGHIVYIIGYDDSQSCWIVKNSWGTDWGETASFTPYTPGAGDGGYFRIEYTTEENIEVNKTYFGTDAVDMNYGGGTVTTTIGPTTTTTIPYPSTTTTTAASSVNLIPYTPSGWDGPIVPSSVMGTSIVNTLCGGKTTYIDVAVANEGASDITETFYIDLYIDGVNTMYWYSSGLQPGYYTYDEDWQTTLQTGTHILKLVVDDDNYVAETNESDNIYSEIFTWKAICPWTSALYESILIEDSQERLSRLRNFRDEVLLLDQTGKKYVGLLYDHSHEIASLLSEDQVLSSQTREVLEYLIPEVSALLDGGKMTISDDVVSDIEVLLDKFEVKASPSLRKAIKKVKREVKRGTIFEQLDIMIE